MREQTRRGFLVWWIGGLLAATAGAALAPLAVYLWPPAAAGSRSKIPVGLAQAVDTLPEGQAVKFDAPLNASFTMVDGGGTNSPGDPTYGGYLTRYRGQLRAFAITCPHLGCSYAHDAGLRHFLCPCHGSEFALDGGVLHGPATAPLSHLAWEPGAARDQILVVGRL